ncbi:MAG: hypothetical protein LQ340_006639 [Diploschistes diacapsis]|nr:MAG: hypothetical protein LQ340_006639 [Diploschistes diacapsis]
MASKTELFPDDCDPITTMEGSVSAFDCPTCCSMLLISIIFFVKIIIWSSLAACSSDLLSPSADCEYPKAAAVAAAAAPVFDCLGEPPSEPPASPSGPASSPVNIFRTHSGSSVPLLTSSLVLSKPANVCPAMSFTLPNKLEAAELAESLARRTVSTAYVPPTAAPPIIAGILSSFEASFGRALANENVRTAGTLCIE